MDAGPLWSFALVGRLDLLGQRLGDGFAWTSAVEDEIRRNANTAPFLQAVLAAPWIPPAIDLRSLGLDQAAFGIRRALSSPGDHPRQHLGEAESITYAKHIGARVFLTEDGAAYRRARFDGVPSQWTTDMLGEIAAMGEANEEELWSLYTRLVTAGRLRAGLTRHELFA